MFFVTVPDATTLTDRLYRLLAGGGGHVNRFRSSDEVASFITAQTGLACQGRRTLFTSFSFLHPANRGQRRNRRLWLLLGAGERTLRLVVWLLRAIDRRYGTRLSVYGWAFHFGAVAEAPPPGPWTNVCIRCGAGHPSAQLLAAGLVNRRRFVSEYRCPGCGTRNYFTDDAPFARSQ